MITMAKIAAAWAAMGQIIAELRGEPDFELRLFGLGFTAGASAVIDEHERQIGSIVAALPSVDLPELPQ